MFIGALIHAGMPLDYLNEKIGKVGLPAHKIAVVENIRTEKYVATHFEWLQEAYFTGISSGEDKGVNLPEWSKLENIIQTLNSSNLEANIKSNAEKIFSCLAEVEAEFRQCRKEEIEFGCVNAAYNIIGAVIGLDYFNIEMVYASEIPMNIDRVSKDARSLNISDQTIFALLKKKNATIQIPPSIHERITMDGAALLASLATFDKPEMKLTNIGVGVGAPDKEEPTILRILIGENNDIHGSIIEIETNIDDMSSQIFGYVMEKLFADGALDVYFTPIYMKKNRPGIKITVIGRKIDEEKLCNILLRETSTLGVKIRLVQDHAGFQKSATVVTKYGEIPVKLKILNGEIIQVTPEYDACAAVAKSTQVGLQRVFQEVIAVGNEKYSIAQ